MSIILNCCDGWILCHKYFLRSVYKGTFSDNCFHDYCFDKYFELTQPFNRADQKVNKFNVIKRKLLDLDDEAVIIKEKFYSILKLASEKSLLDETCDNTTNDASRLHANECFKTIKQFSPLNGGNANRHPITASVEDDVYLFPPSCTFHLDDISKINEYVKGGKYDFILLDPPWYNRFVKRRKKHHPKHGYSFLGNSELSDIPIKDLLQESGLVGIWTTNSPSHINAVKEIIFPSWGIDYIATWFWIKVTKSGEPIVPFSNTSCKQPYERLMFGCKEKQCFKLPEENKCIISVPSSIHSHKPPICEVIESYITDGGKCLEVFARYLVPGWTSFGNQVLSLQMTSLYDYKISG